MQNTSESASAILMCVISWKRIWDWANALLPHFISFLFCSFVSFVDSICCVRVFYILSCYFDMKNALKIRYYA